MLKILRTKTRKVLLVTLILIIPAFVLFGGWSYIQDRQQQQGQSPVRIADPDSNVLGIKGWKRWEELGGMDLLAAQRQMNNFLSYVLGPQMASYWVEEFRDSLYTNRDRINQAVDDRILAKHAIENHIRVSDQEVKQRIEQSLQQVPAEYRKRAFEQMLQEQNFPSEAAFLESVRKEILVDKASQNIMQQAKVSLFEMWQEYLKREQKLKMDYVAFELDQFENRVAVTDAALQQYYNANKEKFRVGDQRQYRYAYFPKSQLQPAGQPTDKQLTEYFEANQEKYAKGPQVRVRQIVFPISTDLTPEQQQASEKGARVKADAAKAELAKKTAFDQVANQMSEDPDNTSADGQTKMGGLVPRWIGQDEAAELGQEYVAAAMKLKPGEVSDVIRVKDGKYAGFAILKGEETRQKSIPAMEEIRPKVVADYKASAQDRLFQEKRQELDTKAKNYNTLDEIAANTQMKTGVSTWTLTTSPIIAPELGVLERENLDYVQSLKPGVRSDLIPSSDNLFFVEVVKQRPSQIPPLSEVRKDVENAYRAEKGRELMKVTAEDFLKKSATAAAMRANAAAAQVQVKSTDFFTRTKMPETLPAPLSDFTADSYPPKKGVVKMSMAGYSPSDASAYVVWAISDFQDPNREAFKKEMASLQRDLLMLKQQTLLEEWLRDQRKTLVVDINPEFIPEGEE